MKKETEQKETATRRKLNILCTQDKGGVGKSLTNVMLANVARSKEFAELVGFKKNYLQVAVFSADPENNETIKTLLGDPGDPYATFAMHNVNKQEGVDGILNAMETHSFADIILTDMRANGMKFMGQITEDPEEYFTTAVDAGYQSALVIPLDGQKDSLQGFNFAATNFGNLPIFIAAHRSTDHAPQDYTRSRTKEYFDIVNTMKKSGKTVVEWNVPQVSKIILGVAEQFKIGVFDERLIQTGAVPLADRGRFRKGYNQVLELYRELYK